MTPVRWITEKREDRAEANLCVVEREEGEAKTLTGERQNVIRVPILPAFILVEMSETYIKSVFEVCHRSQTPNHSSKMRACSGQSHTACTSARKLNKGQVK